MGADTFYTEATGKTAQEAFQNAIDQARWEHGHGGYSGTIAEKGGRGFLLITDSGKDIRLRIKETIKKTKDKLKNLKKAPGTDEEWKRRDLEEELFDLKHALKNFPPKPTPRNIAHALVSMEDRRIDDKWGPAGCIDMTPKLTGKRKPKHFLFFGWASS